MKENTFIGLTKGEIETILDKLNGYGLDLLSDVISAWQFNHEEKSSILQKAFIEIKEVKEHDEIDKYITPHSKIMGLKEGLNSLTEKQLQFMEELLEIDPYMDYPYTNYKDYDGEEDFERKAVGINPYDEIRRYVDEERNNRFETSNNSNILFSRRYYRSLLNDKAIVDTDELFSNRFNKSLKKKLEYVPGDLDSYSK